MPQPNFGTPRRRRREQGRWTSMAFIIEAMVLLVFLAACVAVFTQLFAQAEERAAESQVRAQAIVVAQNAAEQFAADPLAVPATWQEGDLTVDVQVTPDVRWDDGARRGTMYQAQVSVFSERQEAPVYTLQTQRYVSDPWGGEPAPALETTYDAASPEDPAAEGEAI